MASNQKKIHFLCTISLAQSQIYSLDGQMCANIKAIKGGHLKYDG